MDFQLIVDVGGASGTWDVRSVPEGFKTSKWIPIDPKPETVKVMARAVQILRQKLGREDGEIQFKAVPVPPGEDLASSQQDYRPRYMNPWTDAAYYPHADGEGVSHKVTTQPWPGFTSELRRSGKEPGMMIVLRGKDMGPVESITVFFHSDDEPPRDCHARCAHVVLEPRFPRDLTWYCNARHTNRPANGRVYCEEHGGNARAMHESGLPTNG